MYYSTKDEALHEKNSFPVIPDLVPTIDLIPCRTKLLGSPYSKCEPDNNYTEIKCKYAQLLQTMVDTCNCFPSYAKDRFSNSYLEDLSNFHHFDIM